MEVLHTEGCDGGSEENASDGVEVVHGISSLLHNAELALRLLLSLRSQARAGLQEKENSMAEPAHAAAEEKAIGASGKRTLGQREFRATLH